MPSLSDTLVLEPRQVVGGPTAGPGRRAAARTIAILPEVGYSDGDITRLPDAEDIAPP
jgi:hypothetical protein